MIDLDDDDGRAPEIIIIDDDDGPAAEVVDLTGDEDDETVARRLQKSFDAEAKSSPLTSQRSMLPGGADLPRRRSGRTTTRRTRPTCSTRSAVISGPAAARAQRS